MLWLRACAALLAAGGAAGMFDYSALVARGTAATLPGLLRSQGVVFVHFCVEERAACGLEATQINEAAAELKGVAQFVHVNGATDEALCHEHGVRAFPVMKAFVAGEARPYRLPTLKAQLVRYATTWSAPPAAPAADAAALAGMKADHPILVVGYFAGEDDALAHSYLEVAGKERLGQRFAVAYDAGLAAEEGVAVPAVVVYHGDEKHVCADPTAAHVAAHVRKHAYPYISHLDASVYRRLLDRGLPLGWLFVNHNNDVETPNALAVAERLGRKYAGAVSMLVAEGRDQAGFQRQFGLSAYTLPAFVIKEGGPKGRHFLYDEMEDFREDYIDHFIASFLAGEVPPSIRSHPTPMEPTAGGLTTVVGGTFDELVMDRGHDVVWLFHSVGHARSQDALRVLRDVAAAFVGEKGVRVAEFETTGNAPPKHFGVHRPGTVLLAKKRNNDLVVYRGDVTVAGVADFVRQHALTFTRPDLVDEEEADAADEPHAAAKHAAGDDREL